jgi:hypothetical protein
MKGHYYLQQVLSLFYGPHVKQIIGRECKLTSGILQSVLLNTLVELLVTSLVDYTYPGLIHIQVTDYILFGLFTYCNDPVGCPASVRDFMFVKLPVNAFIEFRVFQKNKIVYAYHRFYLASMDPIRHLVAESVVKINSVIFHDACKPEASPK